MFSSCSAVKPFSDACVATGMNIGRLTGPWGSVMIEARARVVLVGFCQLGRATSSGRLTEHLATSSKLSAADDADRVEAILLAAHMLWRGAAS